MKVLIVDDEPLARSRLKRLIAQLSQFKVVGEASDTTMALDLVHSQQPDVLLLDIAMPGTDGIDFATELLALPTPPAVIFVTAHPEHALNAYQAAPADYLLKPVSAERLQQSLEKVGLHTKAHVKRQKNTELKIIYIQAGVRRQLELKDVLFFSAEDKYVRMVYKGGEAIIEQSLVQLLQQFPQQLLRIHRSTLINKTYLDRLVSVNNKHWVRLHGCDDRLEVSRREVANIRSCIC